MHEQFAQSHFMMFAAYNRWANQRLYDATAQLPDADYRANRGAFFGSLHGTLNHILVGDRIWWPRAVKPQEGESTHESRERPAYAH